MTSLMERISERARELHVPLNIHLNLTWKCNERCVHCYEDHEAVAGDMSTAEVKHVLDQLAEAGALFLTISGGEIMLRRDLMEIVAYARSLLFDVVLKTNGTMLRDQDAAEIARLGVRQVNISIYSYNAEGHDAVTLLPGSFARSIEAIRRLKRHGVNVDMRTPLMESNGRDFPKIQALAAELGVEVCFDPTIFPRTDGKLNGDVNPTSLRLHGEKLYQILRDPRLVPTREEFCAPPPSAGQHALTQFPCGAGRNHAHIGPDGAVTPCSLYPMHCGSLRESTFAEVWRSPAIERLQRTRKRDLPVCSTCPNVASCDPCAALAYLEGDDRGASLVDCEKTFAITGIPSPLMVRNGLPA
jgi:MoaA/NifB/PqqE/SkfB family radical SAM enzyme